MTQPNPVMEFLLTRRSKPANALKAPAPDGAALDQLLTAALRVPDHGALEPWRLLLIEDPARPRLAELLRKVVALELLILIPPDHTRNEQRTTFW